LDFHEPPGAYEKFRNFMIGCCRGLIVLGYALWNALHIVQQKREYAWVARHLSEIDHAMALVLQGKYKATSCPICLEAFQIGKDDDAICPFLKSNRKEHDINCCHEESDSRSKKVGTTMKGSDGFAVKLLRCGHVFDETCFNELVNSSCNGNVSRRPICKPDVGKNESRYVNILGSDEQPIEQGNSNETGEDSLLLPSSSRQFYEDERNFRLSRIGLLS